jgi:hypothetical protein
VSRATRVILKVMHLRGRGLTRLCRQVGVLSKVGGSLGSLTVLFEPLIS